MKVANHSSHPELLQSHFSTRKPDLSRRRFLLLAGVGLLAGCSPFSQSPPLPTATPRPRLQRITAENASRLKQVHLLDLQASVHGLAWSPDGHLLAVAPSNQIDLWAVETMNHLLTLKGHAARINGLAWSPDNSLLASVSTDGTTQVWNTKQWQSTATLKHTAQGGSVERMQMGRLSYGRSRPQRTLANGTDSRRKPLSAGATPLEFGESPGHLMVNVSPPIATINIPLYGPHTLGNW